MCRSLGLTGNLKTALYQNLAYRAFSLTWASIYANLLEEKKVFTHRIVLVHQHNRRFIVLEHQYGRRDVM